MFSRQERDKHMTENNSLADTIDTKIQNMIYTFRGKQVMIDSDLAKLYQVETKALNQAVKRNMNRFPENFRFRLNDLEKEQLVTNCDRFKRLKHSTSNPYAFTEQGIAMLSAVLKSDIAVDVSIKIMDSFVEMRKFLISNQELFSRLDRMELKQIETDKKLEKVFNLIAVNTEVKQHIFFDGQIYDAFSLIVDIIRRAKNKIVLIDNYVDTNTLNLLRKKNKGISITILTSGAGDLTGQDISKFNAQYPTLKVKMRNDFHDRFLIIDNQEAYHIGASIKDAGKKSFGISKIEDDALIKNLINRIL